MPMDYDLSDDELADELGAIRNPFRRRRGGGKSMHPAVARKIAARRAAAAAHAAEYESPAGHDELKGDQMLPFPTGTFTATVNSLSLVARPQRRMQCQRLFLSLGRNGATSTARLVTVTAVTVGADPQFTAQVGSFPADAFGSQATGGRLKGTIAERAIDVTVNLGIDAGLVAPDTVTVSPGIIGPAAF